MTNFCDCPTCDSAVELGCPNVGTIKVGDLWLCAQCYDFNESRMDLIASLCHPAKDPTRNS
jgi:hypothetical protein